MMSTLTCSSVKLRIKVIKWSVSGCARMSEESVRAVSSLLLRPCHTRIAVKDVDWQYSAVPFTYNMTEISVRNHV